MAIDLTFLRSLIAKADMNFARDRCESVVDGEDFVGFLCKKHGSSRAIAVFGKPLEYLSRLSTRQSRFRKFDDEQDAWRIIHAAPQRYRIFVVQIEKALSPGHWHLVIMAHDVSARKLYVHDSNGRTHGNGYHLPTFAEALLRDYGVHFPGCTLGNDSARHYEGPQRLHKAARTGYCMAWCAVTCEVLARHPQLRPERLGSMLMQFIENRPGAPETASIDFIRQVHATVMKAMYGTTAACKLLR